MSGGRMLVKIISGIVILSTCASSQLWIQPEQIHLSYGGDPSEMFVMWVTQNMSQESTVEYGIGSLRSSVNGTVTKFVHTPNKTGSHVSYMHRAVMTNLKPGATYLYHVGGISGWSELYNFVAQRTDTTWIPRLGIYGDMGNVNDKALSYIQQEAQRGTLDAILHIGDYAYDLHDDDGYVGDAFMRQIQPIAAYVPYMTCPGNHEKYYNFAHYKSRFMMPGDKGNMMYSFTLGPVLFLSINTEVYVPDEKLPEKSIADQYNWLKLQLQEANKPANRASHPWIIVLGHRPMYCSNDDGLYEHCNNRNNPILVGVNNVTREYSLEDLFYKYGVDMQFYAHEHSYERLWPVYRWTVCNGTGGPYHNPQAPVHIITGSPGDREGQTGFDPVVYPWSAFHTRQYGYTRMTIHNATHIYLDQVSSDKGGAVIDKMWLIKDKHGADTYKCPWQSDENMEQEPEVHWVRK